MIRWAGEAGRAGEAAADAEQASALTATLRACNEAASDVARMARDIGCYRNYDLRRHAYHGIKTDYRLGAQAAQHVIKKVADAYTTPHATIKDGNYGKPGSQRRRRVEATPVTIPLGRRAAVRRQDAVVAVRRAHRVDLDDRRTAQGGRLHRFT